MISALEVRMGHNHDHGASLTGRRLLLSVILQSYLSSVKPPAAEVRALIERAETGLVK
jgi:hypothetical protein